MDIRTKMMLLSMGYKPEPLTAEQNKAVEAKKEALARETMSAYRKKNPIEVGLTDLDSIEF